MNKHAVPGSKAVSALERYQPFVHSRVTFNSHAAEEKCRLSLTPSRLVLLGGFLLLVLFLVHTGQLLQQTVSEIGKPYSRTHLNPALRDQRFATVNRKTEDTIFPLPFSWTEFMKTPEWLSEKKK